MLLLASPLLAAVHFDGDLRLKRLEFPSTTNAGSV
jgi:hypothetical protein